MAFSWQSYGWPVPVRPGAKNPRVFRLPFRVEWDAESRGKLTRMRPEVLRPIMSFEILRRWVTIANQNIIPQAQTNLVGRYWTGATARSLRILGGRTDASGAHLYLGSRLRADDPPMGAGKSAKWLTVPFFYPLGIHEGIKQHRVWIWGRGGAFHRENLEAWARSKGLSPPKGAEWFGWSIRVWRGGRARTRKPFLWRAIQASLTRLSRAIRDSMGAAIFERRAFGRRV